MNTPTPGAASELHTAICQAVALMNRTPSREPEFHEAHTILRQALMNYVEPTRTPAPVQVKPVDGGSTAERVQERASTSDSTKGSSREAVALPELQPGGILGAPPPPDRVQPERRETDWEPCGKCGRWRCDILPSAPPTDASGGVADWRAIAAQLAENLHDYIEGDIREEEALVAFRAYHAALRNEAAGRARKPVDASAQAASAGEPVAWQARHFDTEEKAWGEWHDCRADQLEILRRNGYATRPLYATPTPVAAYREAPFFIRPRSGRYGEGGEVSTIYRHFDEMVWPVPCEALGQLEWIMRYGSAAAIAENAKLAASVIDAYSSLIQRTQRSRNELVRELRKGPNV